jgi:hypothetical protein
VCRVIPASDIANTRYSSEELYEFCQTLQTITQTVNEPLKGHEKDLILDIEEELVFCDESPN